MRVPDNARRDSHFSILFDPTSEEIQLSHVRTENKNLKSRLDNIESLLSKLSNLPGNSTRGSSQ